MPIAITARRTATSAPTCSPAMIAISAAIAPCVDTTGATIPTFPTRSAEYASRSPATLPTPATAIQAPASASSPSGIPLAKARGAVMASPISITQASSCGGPIMRVERELQSVTVAKTSAAPRPPTMASTERT